MPQKASTTPQRRKTTYRHGVHHDEELEDSEDERVPVKRGYRPTPQEDPEERPRAKPAPASREVAYLLGMDGNRDPGLGVMEGDAREMRKKRKEVEREELRVSKQEKKREKRETRAQRSIVSASILAMSEKRKRATVDSEEFDAMEEREQRRGCWLGCSWWFWALVACTLIVVIAVPAGVVSAQKKAAASSVGGTPDPSLGLGENKDRGNPPDDVEALLDVDTWLDTKDFNLTYTDKQVGGLSVMGLFDDYDDSTRCNKNVPPLDEPFPYGEMPIRGVNLGGWLLIEPFITPSFFKNFQARLGVVDEYTLSKELGPISAAEKLENHYKSFVNEITFKEIRDAGLDHVRIPFGYWAAMAIKGDHFVPKISWRYLLRGIEWARKYGLRVKLDLHSVPGGANGWNHSGRLGEINWIKGDDGAENAKKTLELHQQLATFFSQPRYKNIITMYGLVNEPKMTELPVDKVISWSEDAYDVVRAAGYEGQVVFGDGFRGLTKWQGVFTDKEGMLLDVHQYTIFNVNLIGLTHTKKVEFACENWKDEMATSMDRSTG